jgi:hypothetical protein
LGGVALDDIQDPRRHPRGYCRSLAALENGFGQGATETA